MYYVAWAEDVQRNTACIYTVEPPNKGQFGSIAFVLWWEVPFKIAIYSHIKDLKIQWNPSIAATLGERNVGHYIGAAFIEGLFCTQIVHLGPGFLAVIQRWPFNIEGWPLRGFPL